MAIQVKMFAVVVAEDCSAAWSFFAGRVQCGRQGGRKGGKNGSRALTCTRWKEVLMWLMSLDSKLRRLVSGRGEGGVA